MPQPSGFTSRHLSSATASRLCCSVPTLMTGAEPSRLAVGQISQAGPGPGFGFLDLEHAMVVRAAQLHVHRLAALAVPDHHGPSLGPASHRSPQCINTTKATNKP